MDAATAALIGAAIGFLGNALVTWINKHFDERQALREIVVKTAWDHYSELLEVAREKAGEVKDQGVQVIVPPFSVYLFHTIKTLELAFRKNLSDQEIVTEMQKINDHHDKLERLAPSNINFPSTKA